MKLNFYCTIAFAALLGCSGSDTPTGQVAAMAGGEEITAMEVGLEVGRTAANAAEANEQQPAALQAIINRKLLAAAAEERGLDETPEGAMVLQKARELALISLLQRQIQSLVPRPSDADAAAYVAQNPGTFSERKLLVVDQLVAPTASPALIAALGRLQSLEEAASLLTGNRVIFQRTTSIIDPLALEPATAKQVARLGIGDVLVMPQERGVQISQVVEVKPQPVSNENATAVAASILHTQRAAKAVREQFVSIRKQAQADIKINPAYAPKKPLKAGSSSAPQERAK
jgi:EpsD family peptidyl-prolyl cis-trans isomerase